MAPSQSEHLGHEWHNAGNAFDFGDNTKRPPSVVYMQISNVIVPVQAIPVVVP